MFCFTHKFHSLTQSKAQTQNTPHLFVEPLPVFRALGELCAALGVDQRAVLQVAIAAGELQSVCARGAHWTLHAEQCAAVNPIVLFLVLLTQYCASASPGQRLRCARWAPPQSPCGEGGEGGAAFVTVHGEGEGCVCVCVCVLVC